MSRSHRLSDDEGTDPGFSGNHPAGDRRTSLWPLIQFDLNSAARSQSSLSWPRPPEWDHRCTLLAKTNLLGHSVVLRRRGFSAPA